MAANYLRPRRGKNENAVAKLGITNPLRKGEVFFECENIGSARGNIMMGDGETPYNQLTYFLVNEDKAMSYSSCNSINSSTSTADSTLLGSIKSDNISGTFKNAINSIKQLLWNHSSKIKELDSRVKLYQSYYPGYSSLDILNSDNDRRLIAEGQFVASDQKILSSYTQRVYQSYIAEVGREYSIPYNTSETTKTIDFNLEEFVFLEIWIEGTILGKGCKFNPTIMRVWDLGSSAYDPDNQYVTMVYPNPISGSVSYVCFKRVANNKISIFGSGNGALHIKGCYINYCNQWRQ